MPYDVIVRAGSVVDGSGLPPYRADVGISGDRIAAIGDLKGQAAKTVIDADGLTVAPGFVDGHTHMDAQIFWDSLGTNACWHGVTSVVMGNCGFSLAPCGEKDKALVLRNLERAEDISRSAMETGIPWSWETFPQYLDSVERLPKGLNYAGYVGHSALRTYVMGERAFTEKAGADDMAAMKRELEAGIRAGAIGFSTSRAAVHRTPEGRPVASRVADWPEVESLVGVMGDLGSGVFALARANESDPERSRQEKDQIKDLALKTGVPVTFGGGWYRRGSPNGWREHIAMVDEAVAAGARMLIQGTATWNGTLCSFETLMPLDKASVWSDFRKLPLEQQKTGLRDPEMRGKLVDAAKAYRRTNDPSLPNSLLRDLDWEWFLPMQTPLPPHRSMAEIARAQGKDPVDAMIDLALDNDLKQFFMHPANNEDQDVVLAMIRHPHTAVTFSDSGAHVSQALNPVQTHLLGHWVRDKQALTLEAAVRKITFDIASFWGLRGRGLLRQGNYADVVVFDPATIAPTMPSLVRDLPTGAERLLQKATGIAATIVNGEVLLRNGEHTGALPGRLMRGPLAQATN